MTSFTKLSECRYEFVDNEEIDKPQPTAEMLTDFAEEGFVVVKNMFSSTEIDKLQKAVADWPDFWNSEFGLNDMDGNKYSVSTWKDPGSDLMGITAGNAKTVGLAEQLLAKGELYMYHGKVVMKQENTGGVVHWHQDYGYWYNNRALFPDFITCVVALTQSDRHNGGLQVLKRSHRCGRIDHSIVGGQTGADEERVKIVEKLLSCEHADLQAGDCLFFHANMLHKSDKNTSGRKRWNLIFSYNAKSNSPDQIHYNACYGEFELKRYGAHDVKKCTNLKLDSHAATEGKNNPNVKLE